MTQALRVKHDTDPRDEIMVRCKPYLDGLTLMGSRIIVAIYQRPEKTQSGIILPGQVQKEDVYQGKVGLILKMGPMAFTEDDTHKWPVAPKIGDWVAFRVGDTWQLTMDKQPCRMIEDVDVRMIVTEPDVLY